MTSEKLVLPLLCLAALTAQAQQPDFKLYWVPTGAPMHSWIEAPDGAAGDGINHPAPRGISQIRLTCPVGVQLRVKATAMWKNGRRLVWPNVDLCQGSPGNSRFPLIAIEFETPPPGVRIQFTSSNTPGGGWQMPIKTSGNTGATVNVPMIAFAFRGTRGPTFPEYPCAPTRATVGVTAGCEATVRPLSFKYLSAASRGVVAVSSPFCRLGGTFGIPETLAYAPWTFGPVIHATYVRRSEKGATFTVTPREYGIEWAATATASPSAGCNVSSTYRIDLGFQTAPKWTAWPTAFRPTGEPVDLDVDGDGAAEAVTLSRNHGVLYLSYGDAHLDLDPGSDVSPVAGGGVKAVPAFSAVADWLGAEEELSQVYFKLLPGIGFVGQNTEASLTAKLRRIDELEARATDDATRRVLQLLRASNQAKLTGFQYLIKEALNDSEPDRWGGRFSRLVAALKAEHGIE